ncbi:MAG: SigB/SigF/SigG family RNA polymerase sigma factor [Armatimonadetes bacterium]|nr:SigB/SigF/SigG family RNA polymerase sigma factor [Armatimonadota bacterium]
MPDPIHKIVPSHGNGQAQELLAAFIETRDPKLRDQLVLLHLNLVRSLAAQFSDRGEPLEDLIQTGTIGLINALDRFDPAFGTQFSTYATHTILGEIKRHFRDRGWGVKIPRRLQELRGSAMRAAEELRHKLGRAPTIPEIAQAIGSSEEETLEAMELAQTYGTLSLDEFVAAGNEEALAAQAGRLHGDKHVYLWELCNDLNQAIDHLDQREQEIICLRFFGEMSQAQIAEHLSISQAHVSRLQQKALSRLKELLSDG